MYTQSDPRSKRWFVVDAGLALNLPFPPLLRPQRGVDVYIAFDFSGRPSDDASPFEQVLLAENWARLHNLRFPPVEKQASQPFTHPPHTREPYKMPSSVTKNKALLRRAVARFCAEICATSADSNAPRCLRRAGLERVTTTAASVETRRSVKHSITEWLALHRYFKCRPRGLALKHLKTYCRILTRFDIARVNSFTAAVNGSIERSSVLQKHESPLKEQKRVMRQNLREFSKIIKASFPSILLRRFGIVYPMKVMAKYHSSTGNYVIVGSTDIWNTHFPAFQHLRESVLVIFLLECSSPKTPHLPYDFPEGIRAYNSRLIIAHHTPQHLSEIRSRLFHQGYLKDFADFSLQVCHETLALEQLCSRTGLLKKALLCACSGSAHICGPPAWLVVGESTPWNGKAGDEYVLSYDDSSFGTLPSVKPVCSGKLIALSGKKSLKVAELSKHTTSKARGNNGMH
ncbi:Phospholipase A2 [Gryllus bimaculatus]|nr:Phospholipase A2 [Gryllus bimaculatus]